MLEKFRNKVKLCKIKNLGSVQFSRKSLLNKVNFKKLGIFSKKVTLQKLLRIQNANKN